MGEWRYSSTVLDLVTKWRWVVSFTPLPLYPGGNWRRYPLDRKLGGPQSRYRRYREEKNLAPAGIRTPAVQPVARRYADWAIPTPNNVQSNKTNWKSHTEIMPSSGLEGKTPTQLGPLDELTSITGQSLSDSHSYLITWDQANSADSWGRKQMHFPKRRVF
jgi:hypothetical protein